MARASQRQVDLIHKLLEQIDPEKYKTPESRVIAVRQYFGYCYPIALEEITAKQASKVITLLQEGGSIIPISEPCPIPLPLIEGKIYTDCI